LDWASPVNVPAVRDRGALAGPAAGNNAREGAHLAATATDTTRVTTLWLLVAGLQDSAAPRQRSCPTAIRRSWSARRPPTGRCSPPWVVRSCRDARHQAEGL